MSRRENGFGTLVSKGKGKPWLAKWVFNGKTYYKSTGEIDRKKALKELERLTRPYREDSELAVLKNLEARIKTAEAQMARPKSTILIDDLANKYRDSLYAKDLANRTVLGYVSIINVLVAWLKKNTRVKQMKDVTRADAEKFLAEHASTKGVDTYNIHLVFCKKLWTIFKDEGGLSSNVFEDFKKLKRQSNLAKRAFTTDELMKIMTSIDDQNILLLFMLGIYTGLRMGDCCNLKWENIDMFTRTITVLPQKTRRHLTAPIEIPMHQTLYNILVKLHTPNATGYVCKQNAEDYKSRQALRSKIEKVFKRNGIVTSVVDADGHPKRICGFHSLRHTFVSLNINSGMSPLLIQRIVGHSTVDMTSHYFHTNRQAIAAGLAKMPDFSSSSASALPCPQAPCMELQESDIELLKKCFDASRDTCLSDTVKRLVDAHLNVIEAA